MNNKSKKLNLVYFMASSKLGGLEKSFVDLCNMIYHDSNINLEVILFKNNKVESLLNQNIRVIKIKKFSRFNFFQYFKLIKIVKNKIIHTHGAKATEIIYLLSKFIDFVHIGTKHNSRKGNIFNKLKYVTAVSKEVSLTIKNNNVEVIYNGISPINIINYTKNEVFTIRAIGRLDKIKGFDKLIKDFSKIKNNCILEIVGEGEEYNNLSKLIKNLQLENRIKLLGFSNEIPKLISTADLVLMTSLSEGFSLVMIESIFYAKLFISTKVSGCKEILPDSLIIEKFNISEKINQILENYNFYYQEFAKVKEKYKKELLLENVVQNYLNYYRKLKD